MNDLLAAALEYATKGWRVFPVKARGKTPLTASGLKAATADHAIIRDWWKKWPNANVGIPTENVIVIDIDGAQGESSIQALEAQFGPLPKTLESSTARGRHVWFTPNSASIRNSAGKLGEGIDIRGIGGYVVGPPSIHESGKRYEWISGDAPLAELPAWLAAKLKEPTAHTGSSTNGQGQKIPKGERNSTLTSLAGVMRRKGMSDAPIRAALLLHNQEHCDPPLPEHEVSIIATSVSRYRAAAQQSVGELIRNDEGKLRPLLANAITVLRSRPEWQGVLAYNEFTLSTVTHKPAPWQTVSGRNWTDYDDLKLAEYLQHKGVLVNSKLAGEAAQAVAYENPFHPVRDYLNSITWDGTKRLDTWLAVYLGAAYTPFTEAVGTRWLLSAVARIIRPGCQADYTLVLEGIQGTKKSTALRTVAGECWFTDHISDVSSKDARLDLHGVWIVEMAELASIRRSLTEQVKNFLTATSDNFRPPYGRRTQRVPRTNVFAGSVNDAAYLVDETGNRRFWPIHCGTIDIAALTRDRDQLWAEAYSRFKRGDPWWLETTELEKLATEEQEQRYEEGVWDDVILRWLEAPAARSKFDPEARINKLIEPFSSEVGRITITDVLLHAIGKDLNNCKQVDRNQVARCLTHAGWKRKQIRVGGRQTWFYVCGRPPEVE